jgi:hypothetical protein
LRGGVQLKGGVGTAGDSYEQHAVVVAACGSRSVANEVPASEQAKGTPMITKNSSASAAADCPGVNAALKAVLLDEPIDSFSRPDRSGHQALVRLAIGADALRAIGLDARCPNVVRFAAFEGWSGLAGANVLGALDDATAGEMATVYGEAIRTTDDAAVWNLPPDVTSSVVARHLIVLGARAATVAPAARRHARAAIRWQRDLGDRGHQALPGRRSRRRGDRGDGWDAVSGWEDAGGSRTSADRATREAMTGGGDADGLEFGTMLVARQLDAELAPRTAQPGRIGSRANSIRGAHCLRARGR